MTPPGTELSLGAIHDPGFGAVVILSAGGVMIEFLADRVADLAPLDADAAARLLAELRVSGLLAGHRGQPPADSAAILDQLTRFSHMVAALGDAVAEIDVNPDLQRAGACAVDCQVPADHSNASAALAPRNCDMTSRPDEMMIRTVEMAAIVGSIWSRSARNMLRVIVELSPPETNSEMMISSKDIRKEISDAEISENLICGSVISIKA